MPPHRHLFTKGKNSEKNNTRMRWYNIYVVLTYCTHNYLQCQVGKE